MKVSLSWILIPADGIATLAVRGIVNIRLARSSRTQLEAEVVVDDSLNQVAGIVILRVGIVDKHDTERCILRTVLQQAGCIRL